MSKYKAKATTVDNIRFASQKEANYYLELKIAKRAKAIKDFSLQPEYELQPKYKKRGKVVRAIKYKADFLIIENDGTETIVDCKGFLTPVYKLKKKLFEYKYPDLFIQEV